MAEAVDILERQVKDLERKRDDLEKDNRTQRDELREARDRIKALETDTENLRKQVPAEGSVTLSKADVERWTAYQAVGKVDEVKTKISRLAELETKDAQRTRQDSIKALNLKPSIFELIAEGKTFRADGEGDERKVYLTVDDKEQELTAYAQERGLDDLLGVMGLEAKEPEKSGGTPTGAGTRKPGEFKALPAAERVKQKDRESRYSGM